jgi:hypothetical protein
MGLPMRLIRGDKSGKGPSISWPLLQASSLYFALVQLSINWDDAFVALANLADSAEQYQFVAPRQGANEGGPPLS